MSDYHKVGLDVVSFENVGTAKPISRVTLRVDGEKCFTAGDDTGRELTAPCPTATQEMVDAILASVSGFEYKAYNAGSAGLDPAAELGDGISVGEVYSVVAAISNNGHGFPDVSAPGEAELEEDDPYISPMQQEINRKTSQTRALIEKTAEEIRLSVSEVSDDLSTLEGSVSELSVKLNSITLSVSNGAYSSTIKLLANGIEIASQDISMSGMITVWDLSQSGATTINGDNITTGTIEGRTFRSILDASGGVGGEIEMCYLNNTTVAGGIRLDDQGAGTDSDRKYRMFLYTEEVEGVAFALKLKSASGMSLEAVDNIYMHAGTVFRLIAPEIRLTGTVYINGVEYVPPTTEEETT